MAWSAPQFRSVYREMAFRSARARRENSHLGNVRLFRRYLPDVAAHLFENITFCDAALFSGLECRAQSFQLRLIFLLVLFQRAQPRPKHFAGIGVAPIPNPRGDELI